MALRDRDFDDESVALLWLFHHELLPAFHKARHRSLALFSSDAALSAREREVSQLLVLGHSEKEVAHSLGISVHTCHQYVKSVYRKLGVRSRAQLVRAAFSRGS